MLGQEFASTLRRFMELRDTRDETKKAAEIAEAEYREAEAELWEKLDESPVAGAIKVDIGPPYGTVTFQPRETYFGRVLDKEKALDYFEQSAQVDEFTTPKIAMQRVNELVRACIEEGKQPPDGIDWYAKRFVSVTRPK